MAGQLLQRKHSGPIIGLQQGQVLANSDKGKKNRILFSLILIVRLWLELCTHVPLPFSSWGSIMKGKIARAAAPLTPRDQHSSRPGRADIRK
jgi:hypothetical protein